MCKMYDDHILHILFLLVAQEMKFCCKMVMLVLQSVLVMDRFSTLAAIFWM